MIRLSCKAPPPLGDLLTTDVEWRAAEPQYWAPGFAYQFTAQEIDALLKPAAEELWALCRDFAARAVADDEILASLGIPEAAWDGIAESWRRADPVALARFDLRFDGVAAPRLHECNIDVVGLLFEATLFQSRWFEHQRSTDKAFHKAGQCAAIADSLAAALRSGGHRQAQLLAFDPDPYDALWIATLASILEPRGIACSRRSFDDLAGLCRFAEGQMKSGSAAALIKSFRWDSVTADPDALLRFTAAAPRIFSPLWSLVLSSKGCLPWLWKLNPGHPNLLPASFDAADLAGAPGVVAKPLFSIQGENITLDDRIEPHHSMATGGPHPAGRRIFQELCYLPKFTTDGPPCCASTGAWIVNERFAALSLTESNGPVINGADIRYVPHVIAT